MIRLIFISVMTIVCFVLQTTLFRFLAFSGVGPNLMIALTASLGLMRGQKTGIVLGFFCGLLQDIFFGDVLGFYALVYMYIGFLSGAFFKVFYPEDLKLPLALIIIGDLIYGGVTYILLFALMGKLDLEYYLVANILPEVVYTLAVTVLLYPLLLFADKKISHIELLLERQ